MLWNLLIKFEEPYQTVLFLHENIRYEYSLDMPRKVASNEYTKHMFSCRNKKNFNTKKNKQTENKPLSWSYAVSIFTKAILCMVHLNLFMKDFKVSGSPLIG